MLQTYEDMRIGERGAWLSIVSYIVLSAMKLMIGYIAHSEALLADGLNNTTDIIASAAVLIGLRISRKPPDANHQYGHFRAESIASLIASFIMISVGLQVLYQAGLSVYQPNNELPDMIAGWTALGSAAVTYGVYLYNYNLAEKINSQSLMAAAQDNRSDALVSIGAFIGILGAQWGLPWLDPVAAFVVGVIICKTAWDIFRDASLTLTDGYDEEHLSELKRTVEKTPGVKRVKDIKARLQGNIILVDVIICVDDHLNVVESHRITEEVEKRMAKQHKIKYVHIHIEPLREKV